MKDVLRKYKEFTFVNSGKLIVFITPRFHKNLDFFLDFCLDFSLDIEFRTTWFQSLPLRRYRCVSESPWAQDMLLLFVPTSFFFMYRKQGLTTVFMLKTPILNSLLILGTNEAHVLWWKLMCLHRCLWFIADGDRYSPVQCSRAKNKK